MAYKKYIVKNDDFEKLIKFGFVQSKVSIFPMSMVKVVDAENKYIIEVCNDPKRGYNVWSGEDWKEVGVLKLWKCKRLDLDYLWRSSGEVSPYYERDRTLNELIEDYISDLISEGLIDIIGGKNDNLYTRSPSRFMGR